MVNRNNIGIITQLYNANYGGILQIYALMTYLRNEGYNVKYINRQYPEKNKMLKLLRDIAKFIIQKNRKRNKKNNKLNIFFLQHIQPRTKPICTRNDFKNLNKEHFTTIIAGSDQIWRPGPLLEDYFLGFTNLLNYNVHKIAYSASFGVDEWLFNTETTIKLKQLATKFNAVSVRESSGIELCEKYLGVNAQLTLDPTFLLPPEHYISLIGERKDKEPYIASYILDMNDDKRQICSYISNKCSLPIHHIHQTDNNKVRQSIPSWLKNIYEADFVITDSFHGTVFSIIFNKPFIAIGNKERGMSRFTSLLTLFSLENRLLTTYDQFEINRILNNPINWKSVNDKKNTLVEISKTYLRENIL